eukprot:TRINITY_DN4963_c0_g1_i1.p3 TRINITY_DN4963_c0_g1~~TRINITY_DN4963_c0_g1_i1.p3  ORF type:complete len:161 (-),score=8.10 TRINITY_DN4963_c0_g1_i1:261-743(-)
MHAGRGHGAAGTGARPKPRGAASGGGGGTARSDAAHRHRRRSVRASPAHGLPWARVRSRRPHRHEGGVLHRRHPHLLPHPPAAVRRRRQTPPLPLPPPRVARRRSRGTTKRQSQSMTIGDRFHDTNPCRCRWVGRPCWRRAVDARRGHPIATAGAPQLRA